MIEKRLLAQCFHEPNYFTKMVLNGVCMLIISFLSAYFISETVAHIFLDGATFEQQLPLLLGLGTALFTKAGLTAWFQHSFYRSAEAIKHRLLLQAADGILSEGPVRSHSDFSGAGTSVLFESADMAEQYYSDYLPQFFALVIQLPLLLLIVFVRDWITGLIMLVTGPLLPFFMALIGARSKKANEKRLQGLGNLSGSLSDCLQGARTIKVFGAERHFRQSIADSSDQFRLLTMEVLRISFLSAFVLELASTISTAMIAVSLGLRLMAKLLPFVTAFFVLLLTPDYYLTIRKFGAKFHLAMGAKSAADFLFQYEAQTSAPPVISQKQKMYDLDISSGCEITVTDASFTYEGSNQAAIKHLNLTCKQGKLTALVGKSGSGKSTLAYALMRFIALDEGDIRINGERIADKDVHFLRRGIAYIPQRPYVFQDTLRNNLLISKPDATDEELLTAIDQAALVSFLHQLSHGLDTLLTEQGGNISVGEAQRISFARAYLKNCPILLMDEATSALDSENEALIKNAFEQLAREKTVLVIAHRLDTVKQADQIYVLEAGSVAESGTHQELLGAKGLYHGLISTWNS